MRTKCIAAKQNFSQIWALQIFCFSLQNFPVPFNICLYRSPKKEVYWQVASNIFPKAWTKKTCQFVNPFLPIQYKNGSGNSHPIPSWKLRECAGETGSDSGVNKKKTRSNSSMKWPDDTKSHTLHDSKQPMAQVSKCCGVCEHAQLNTARHPQSSLKYDSLP